MCPMPLGFTVETQAIDRDVIARRVIDPGTVTVVERIFASVERGLSFGDVSRMLNQRSPRIIARLARSLRAATPRGRRPRLP